MLWLSIAWRNLWRNRRRSGFQIASIAFGIFFATFMTNLSHGAYEQMIENGVRMTSGHVGFYHPRYQEEHRAGDLVPAGALMRELEQEPGVEALYPRIRLAGLVRSSRDSRPGMALGLDLDREKDVNPLLAPKNLVAGELPAPTSDKGLVMGEALAQELGLKVGKKVVWMAQDAHGEIASKLFRVSGLIRTGIREVDTGTVIMPRHALAELLGAPDGAHELGVMLAGTDRIPAMLPRLRDIAAQHPDVAALTWQEAMPSLASGIAMKASSQQVLYLILYLLVGIGTVNTLLMSVMERTREFGVLRALGVGKRQLRLMVLLEALGLGLSGAIAGLGATVLVGLYTATKGIDLSAKISTLEMGGVGLDPVMRSGWDVPGMLWLSLGMIALTVLASIYPARWVMSIRPADAMRNPS